MSKRLQKLREQWNDARLMRLPGVNGIESSRIFSAVVEADPTPGHKYVDWTLKAWARETFQWEDICEGAQSRVADQLLRFESNKHRIPDPAMRSLMKYRSPGELDYAMDEIGIAKQVSDFDLSSSQKKKLMMAKARMESIHHETGTGLQFDIPLTQYASQILGRNTRWCTAASKNNQFQEYSNYGLLYIITLPNGERFQAHLEVDLEDIAIKLDNLARGQTGLEPLSGFTLLDDNDSHPNTRKLEVLKPYIVEIKEYIGGRLADKYQEKDGPVPSCSETIKDILGKTIDNELGISKQQDPIFFSKIDWDVAAALPIEGVDILPWDPKNPGVSYLIKETPKLSELMKSIPFSSRHNLEHVSMDFDKTLDKVAIYNDYISALISYDIYDGQNGHGISIKIHGEDIQDHKLHILKLMLMKNAELDENDVISPDIFESTINKLWIGLTETQKDIFSRDAYANNPTIKNNKYIQRYLFNRAYSKVMSFHELQEMTGVTQDINNTHDVKRFLRQHVWHNNVRPELNKDFIDVLFKHKDLVVQYHYETIKREPEELTNDEIRFLIWSSIRELSLEDTFQKLKCIFSVISNKESDTSIKVMAWQQLMNFFLTVDDDIITINNVSKEISVPDIIKDSGILDILEDDIVRLPEKATFRHLSKMEQDEYARFVVLSAAYGAYDPETENTLKKEPVQILETVIQRKRDRLERMEHLLNGGRIPKGILDIPTVKERILDNIRRNQFYIRDIEGYCLSLHRLPREQSRLGPSELSM